MKFRLVIDIERCKGCALCVSACGRDVLKMSGKLNAKGYYYVKAGGKDDCAGCLQCAVMCPDAAIEIIQEGK